MQIFVPSLRLSSARLIVHSHVRDKTAARRYFEKPIARNGLPETVAIDKSGASLAVLEAINADRETPIKIRQSKYLNNLVEQDRRAAMRCTHLCWGSSLFAAPGSCWASIAVMHMIIKGQMKCSRNLPSTTDQFYGLAT
jgi:transposase-like protein